MSQDQNNSVDVGTVAAMLNITVMRVQQLVKLGVVIRTERGKYDLAGSVQGYVKYKEGIKEGRDPDASIAGEVCGEDYHLHRARLYKARADAAELEANRLSGRQHDADAVREAWVDMITNARAKLLGLPNKIAASVQGLSDIAEIKSRVEEAIYEALNELTNYDPKRVTREPVQGNQSDMEAAAEADGESMG